MYCSKCGKEINDEAMICPECGCATKNYYAMSAPVEQANTSDYIKIHAFHEKAKSLRNLGIVAAVLMFGIGIIFTIIMAFMSRGCVAPTVTTTNVKELAELEEGKRYLKTANILGVLPFFAIIICFLVGCIIGMTGC